MVDDDRVGPPHHVSRRKSDSHDDTELGFRERHVMEGTITVGHLIQDNKAISFLLWTRFTMNGAISIEAKWDEINVGLSAGLFEFPVLGISGSREFSHMTILFSKSIDRNDIHVNCHIISRTTQVFDENITRPA